MANQTNGQYAAQYVQLQDSQFDKIAEEFFGNPDAWKNTETTNDSRFFLDCMAMADQIKAQITAVHGRYRPSRNKHFPAEEPAYKDIKFSADKAVADIDAYSRQHKQPVPDKKVQDEIYHLLVRYLCRLIPEI